MHSLNLRADLAFVPQESSLPMPAKSAVMIPFGSSEKNVRVVMNDLLSIYLCNMLAVHSKLITLAFCSARIKCKNTNLPQ